MLRTLIFKFVLVIWFLKKKNRALQRERALKARRNIKRHKRELQPLCNSPLRLLLHSALIRLRLCPRIIKRRDIGHPCPKLFLYNETRIIMDSCLRLGVLENRAYRRKQNTWCNKYEYIG